MWTTKSVLKQKDVKIILLAEIQTKNLYLLNLSITLYFLRANQLKIKRVLVKGYVWFILRLNVCIILLTILYYHHTILSVYYSISESSLFRESYTFRENQFIDIRVLKFSSFVPRTNSKSNNIPLTFHR